MPNDERKGRRLGDETRVRIADLASGWTVDGDAPPPEPAVRDASPVRRRSGSTVPPPPPGSAERMAREDKIPEVELEPDVEDDDGIEVAWIEPAPAKRPTQPPPLPSAMGSASEPDRRGERQRRPTGAVPLASRGESADAWPPEPAALGRGELDGRSPGYATGAAPLVNGAELPDGGRPQVRPTGAAPTVGSRAELPDPGASRNRPQVRSTEPAPTVGGMAAPEPVRNATPRPRAMRSTDLSQEITAAKPRTSRDGAPVDLSAEPELDKTTENRGAVGVRHERMGGLTANAASGTIGGETPHPVFDRALIANASHAVDRGGVHKPLTGSVPVGSAPVPVVAAEVRASGTVPPAPRASRPPTSNDDSISETLAELGLTGPRLAVPVGEFEDGETLIEQSKFRAAYSQATLRGAATPPPFSPSAVAPVASSGPVPVVPSGVATIAPSGPRPVMSSGPVPVVPSETRSLTPPAVMVTPRSLAAMQDASGSSTGRFEHEPGAETAWRGAEGGPRGGLDAHAEDARDDGDGDRGGGVDRAADDESEARHEIDATLAVAPRGDATTISAPDAGTAPSTGTLRRMASLRRQRGLLGDMRYVATVVFGLRAAKRELAELDAQQVKRQQSRRHHQVTLGRTAVGLADGYGPEPVAEHPALGPAREQLMAIEDERSRHAGHVAAADAELDKVRRERDAAAKQYAVDLAALDAEIDRAAKDLVPLRQQIKDVRRRGVNFHEALRRLDAQIAAAVASLATVDKTKVDPSTIQTEIATLKANRLEAQRQEPVIAGALDSLNPRIAELEAARGEAQRRRAELIAAERDDQQRVQDLLVAIGTQRKVVDRDVATSEARRDKVLFQLGERLCVDRPAGLASQLAPIDEIDVELGVADRRIMELREIESSVDAWKVTRGVALLSVLAGVFAAAALWGLDHWIQPLF